mgnify:CR=1 FL=1
MKYSGSISDRIKALRAEMRREKIDLYIIPSTDYHNSEYIGEYFKERQYMTGFTGSAGTVVFGQTGAILYRQNKNCRAVRSSFLKQGSRAARKSKNLYGQNCRKAERSDLMAVRFG